MKRSPKTLNALQSEWLAHIEASRRSDQSVADYARDHGIEAQQVYTWTTRLRRLGVLTAKGQPVRRARKKPGHPKLSAGHAHSLDALRFSPVEVLPEPRPSSFGMRIEFSNGIVLKLPEKIVPDPKVLSLLASQR